MGIQKSKPSNRNKGITGALSEKEKEKAKSFFKKGMAEVREKHYRRAIRYFNSVLKLAPGRTAAYKAKAHALSSLYKHREAINTYYKGLKLAKVKKTFLMNIGVGYCDLNVVEHPMDYASALSFNPKDDFYYKNKARILKKSTEMINRLESLCFQTVTDPYNGLLFYNIGTGLVRLFEYKESIKKIKPQTLIN